MESNFNHKEKVNKIKICYWNVHGVKSQIIGDKLLDPEFLGKLQNSDIVSLAELHTEEEGVFLPGYRMLKQKIRKKVHKGTGQREDFIRSDRFLRVSLRISRRAHVSCPRGTRRMGCRMQGCSIFVKQINLQL